MSDRFRRDLQAWTEEKVNALLRRKAKAASQRKPIAKAITSLLGDRVQMALDILVGSEIEAEFIRGGIRSGDNFTKTTQSQLEHGLLSWNYPATFPLKIYTELSIQSYLASAGTLIPDTSNSEYLMGVGVRLQSKCGLTDYPAYNWPDNPQPLDGDNSYDATIWESVAPTGKGPEWSSGLGILFWQCWYGAGKNVSTILPDGWPNDPRYVGIIRSPDWQYWLRLTNSAGCLLTKLTIPSWAQCWRGWLINDNVTGIDAELVESWLIASLTRNSLSPVYTVVTELQMRAVYFPVMNGDWRVFTDMCDWGWQWSYQTKGSDHQDDAYACLATIGFAGSGLAYGSLLSRLDITWDDDNNPENGTLTIISGTGWYPNPAVLSLFTFDGTQLARFYVPDEPTASSGTGYLAAWVDSSGQIRIAGIGHITVHGVGGIGIPAWNALVAEQYVCTTGYAQIDAYLSLGAGVEASVVIAGGTLSVESTSSYEYRKWEIQVTDGRTVTAAGCTGGKTSYKGCFGDAETVDCELSDTWTITYGDIAGETWRKNQTKIKRAGGGGIIVVFGQPRCVWGYVSESFGSGSSDANSKQRKTSEEPTHAEHTKGYSSQWLWNNGSFAYGVYQEYGTNVNISGTTAKSALVAISDIVETCPADAAWWTQLANVPPGYTIGIIPYGIASYYGQVLYTDKPGDATDPWEFSHADGLDEDCINPGMAWIGRT